MNAPTVPAVMASEPSVRSIPVSTLRLQDVLDSEAARAHDAAHASRVASRSNTGLLLLHGAALADSGPPPASRESGMGGDVGPTPRSKGGRRVSLLSGGSTGFPGQDDPSAPAHADSCAFSKKSSGLGGVQKQRRRSKLMNNADEQQAAEDDMAALAAMDFDRKWWHWRPTVIMPNTRWYMIFWYFTMFYAMLNAILDPYDLAFGATTGWRSGLDFWSFIEYLGTVVFLVDIVLKFFLAYEDETRKQFLTDFPSIARHYLSLLFWFDLLFWFPFVPVILTARPDFLILSEPDYVAIPDSATCTGYYIGLLGFLKLGRLYRIFALFDHLDHTMVISQMSLMLLRNFVYIMLTCHWFACIFYFIARAEAYSKTGSWIGRHLERFGDKAGTSYVYSFYLSVTAFSGMGDGDFYSGSPAESIAMTVYLLFNVVLGAYILGTVTMLMVKGDERSKTYRDRISALNDYTIINELPGQLHDAMRAHLELHFESEMCSDEYVLALYPSAIRRKVLRHLYLEPLKRCYLFKSSKPKFLDATLAVCRVDLFMPSVHLISEGDIVSELYVVIEGEVDVVAGAPGACDAADPASRANSATGKFGAGGGGRDSDGMKALASLKSYSHAASVEIHADATGGGGAGHRGSTGGFHRGSTGGFHRGSTGLGRQESSHATALDATGEGGGGGGVGSERRGSSECFGEVAFFTETPSCDSVWTCSVVRVLVVPRAAYATLCASYPNQIRALINDLRKRTELSMLEFLSDAIAKIPPSSSASSTLSQMEKYMSCGQVSANLPAPLLRELKGLMTAEQAAQLDQLEHTKDSIISFSRKQDRQRVYEMLSSAAKGDDDSVKTLFSQGVGANCADCDKRTPLILAAQEGKESTVKLLLEQGADVHTLDVFGMNALIGAIKHGHDFVAETLVSSGASLAHCTEHILPDVMESVIDGDLAKLARYLRGGADPNMANHDARTPLHMAAAEGSLAAVKILVEAGADVDVQDRWGNSPIDDATHARAMPVVEFLGAYGDQAVVNASSRDASANGGWGTAGASGFAAPAFGSRPASGTSLLKKGSFKHQKVTRSLEEAVAALAGGGSGGGSGHGMGHAKHVMLQAPSPAPAAVSRSNGGSGNGGGSGNSSGSNASNAPLRAGSCDSRRQQQPGEPSNDVQPFSETTGRHSELTHEDTPLFELDALAAYEESIRLEKDALQAAQAPPADAWGAAVHALRAEAAANGAHGDDTDDDDGGDAALAALSAAVAAVAASGPGSAAKGMLRNRSSAAHSPSPTAAGPRAMPDPNSVSAFSLGNGGSARGSPSGAAAEGARSTSVPPPPAHLANGAGGGAAAGAGAGGERRPSTVAAPAAIPSRSASPLSFHMAQLLAVEPQQPAGGSRRASVGPMTSAAAAPAGTPRAMPDLLATSPTGSGSGRLNLPPGPARTGSTGRLIGGGAQPTYWRESPLFSASPEPPEDL